MNTPKPRHTKTTVIISYIVSTICLSAFTIPFILGIAHLFGALDYEKHYIMFAIGVAFGITHFAAIQNNKINL